MNRLLPSVPPGWLLFLLDVSLGAAAFLLAYWISESQHGPDQTRQDPYRALAVLTMANALVLYVFDLTKGIIRYASFHALGRLFLVCFLSTLLLALLNLGFALFETPNPLLFWLGYPFLFVFLLGTHRVGAQYAYHYSFSGRKPTRNAVVYGTGKLGTATKAAMDKSPALHLVLFIDDNPGEHRKSLDGIPVVGFEAFARLHTKKAFDTVIFAVKSPDPGKKKQLLDFCLEHRINVLKSPSPEAWPRQEPCLGQLQRLRVEDLLERQPIPIHKPELAGHFAGKRVLVTGAAGAIGSELLRQILRYMPLSIIACDHAETPLYHLLLELEPLRCGVGLQPYLASVGDKARMERLFRVYRPDYVFHAAAYKQVAMMNLFPSEAIRINTLATQRVADLSAKWNVQRFVLVSTDKTAKPGNIADASKYLAETYVRGLSQTGTQPTRFMITRFGNALDSNDPTLQRFQSQIESGSPLTAAYPDTTYYHFMLLPEVCQLVLEASQKGQGGEVFTFDMGQPVKSTDIAQKMIRLNGLQPGIDIPIRLDELNPGEEPFQEIPGQPEESLEPYHENILTTNVRPIDTHVVNRHFSILDALLKEGTPEEKLVAYIKNVLTESIHPNNAPGRIDQ